MNKNTYLGLALAVCMGLVSAPLLAEITPAPEQPANITEPSTTPEQHRYASERELQYAEHHKGMAEHHKSVAKEYEKAGHHDLKKHHEAMAAHHEALAKEHEKTAATHKKLAQ
jgi:hypothetical protein